MRYQISTGWVYKDRVDGDISDHNNLMIEDDCVVVVMKEEEKWERAVAVMMKQRGRALPR